MVFIVFFSSKQSCFSKSVSGLHSRLPSFFTIEISASCLNSSSPRYNPEFQYYFLACMKSTFVCSILWTKNSFSYVRNSVKFDNKEIIISGHCTAHQTIKRLLFEGLPSFPFLKIILHFSESIFAFLGNNFYIFQKVF